MTSGSSDVVGTIAVVCDSRRHRRPKPEKLVTLTFYTDGEWSSDTNEHRLRRYARLTEAAVEGRDVHIASLRTLFGRDPVKCGLCGRPLPSDRQISEAVETLAELASGGVSILTLTQLAPIVSRQK